MTSLLSTPAYPLSFTERRLSWDDRKGAQVWPHGAKLAVLLYTSLEEWAWDRMEPLTPHGTLMMAGEKVPNLGMRSAVSYGFHIGLKRLRDIWGERGLKVMLWVTGNAAEQHPEIVSELAELGHQIGGHGYSEGMPPTLM